MKPPIAEQLHLDLRKLPAEVFNRLASRAGARRDWKAREEKAWNNFGKPGRDPGKLGGVMSVIASDGDWTPHLKLAQLRNHWDLVVGPAIAAHSVVTDFRDGVLTINTESNAWATQLTYLIPQLTATIRQRLRGLEIREIRVTGPQSHNFRRGPGARRYPNRYMRR
ncbi:DUF721 domain-containing protein [Bifidobacterium sp. ESL0764]|uniref:DUF721 domain-containing protein n=1 Tax=Bifidobacterium sp. ESL0764 TaxID=2983228 RepID=UPI0023F921A5|nr:DUF721 domain-containing protein [Bifidobacterium sp. ESL0764]WEV65806.1 DUF721 domain-containing protein [Bifidobacterium sp. ESL0764]